LGGLIQVGIDIQADAQGCSEECREGKFHGLALAPGQAAFCADLQDLARWRVCMPRRSSDGCLGWITRLPANKMTIHWVAISEKSKHFPAKVDMTFKLSRLVMLTIGSGS